MPYDPDESRILGELQDLEDEIRAVTLSCDYFATYCPSNPTEQLKAIGRVILKLEQDKERLESHLKIHRQKVKESGIKF